MFSKLFGKRKEEKTTVKTNTIQKESKRVHCEITGDESGTEKTVPLVRIDGIVAFKNIPNGEVDEVNKQILSPGHAPLNYYSELYVPDDLKNMFGRLFSLINDEDDIEQSTAIISEEGRKKFSGQRLVSFMEHILNGTIIINIPPSMFLSVIDTTYRMRSKTCDNWGTEFKSIGKKYRYKTIVSEKKEAQTYGMPGILPSGYDVAVGDCSDKNPNGTGYIYKTDGSFKSVDLACNESAVSFCRKNNVIVYYNDFLNNGKLRVLTSKTESINRNLQNSYLFRSSNL